MQQPLQWFDRLIVPLLGAIAAVILFVLMMLTCVDVVGRYFFNKPIYGAFEMTEVMLACLIFAGLPLVTLKQEHVSVDVFDPITSDAVLRVQYVIASIIASAATAYLAWRVFLRAGTMLASGETTAQLKLPLGYVTYTMSGLLALTSLCFLVLVFRCPSREPTGEV